MQPAPPSLQILRPLRTQSNCARGASGPRNCNVAHRKCKRPPGFWTVAPRWSGAALAGCTRAAGFAADDDGVHAARSFGQRHCSLARRWHRCSRLQRRSALPAHIVDGALRTRRRGSRHSMSCTIHSRCICVLARLLTAAAPPLRLRRRAPTNGTPHSCTPLLLWGKRSLSSWDLGARPRSSCTFSLRLRPAGLPPDSSPRLSHMRTQDAARLVAERARGAGGRPHRDMAGLGAADGPVTEPAQSGRSLCDDALLARQRRPATRNCRLPGGVRLAFRPIGPRARLVRDARLS